MLPRHPFLIYGLPSSMSAEHTDETNNLDQLTALDQRLNGPSSSDDGIHDVEERAAPGMLRFLPPLLQDFWARKAYFTMDQQGAIQMDGFYKHGPMRLDIRDNNQLVAIDRRNRETKINSFDDLVMLNFEWWKSSNTKNQYVVPQRPWIDSFTEKKLVKRKVIYLPYDAEDNAEEA